MRLSLPDEAVFLCLSPSPLFTGFLKSSTGSYDLPCSVPSSYPGPSAHPDTVHWRGDTGVCPHLLHSCTLHRMARWRDMVRCLVTSLKFFPCHHGAGRTSSSVEWGRQYQPPGTRVAGGSGGGAQPCHPNQASAVQATRCPPAAVERRDLHHGPLNGHCRVTNSSCWGSISITAKRAVGRCRHVPSRTMEAQLCATSYLPLQFTSYCY